jgi:hypothetical protein
VDTTWQCGPAEPAVIHTTGRVTSQTLQACIRVHNGKLDLRGILDGTIAAWEEQIVLVLKDSAQNDGGYYYSPVCTATDCVFTVAAVPPSRGEWTVLPEWERYNGNYQSAGSEAGFIDF